MGWSCSRLAMDTMDKWSKACISQTGSQNRYKSKGSIYFFEHSRKEYGDGAITGSIWRMVGAGHCRKTGSFRIEGDGSVTRAPSFFLRLNKTGARVGE